MDSVALAAIFILFVMFGMPIAVTAMILGYMRKSRQLKSASSAELAAIREEIRALRSEMEERVAEMTLLVDDSRQDALRTLEARRLTDGNPEGGDSK